jgi:hypothetical protein
MNDNVNRNTKLLGGTSFEEAARVVACETFPTERSSGGQEASEVWRTRIRNHVSDAAVEAIG